MSEIYNMDTDFPQHAVLTVSVGRRLSDRWEKSRRDNLGLFCAMQVMMSVRLVTIYFLDFVKNRSWKAISFAYVQYTLKDRRLIKY